MKERSAQKAIVEKHLANDFPLLEKYDSNLIGSGGYDPTFFSASYELVGLVNRENKFLPHFEFNVGTGYAIHIPQDSLPGGTIYHEGGGIRLNLKAKKNGGLVEVTFPSVPDLFHLRNLASEGQLLSIPETNEEDRAKLPIDESQIKTGFNFRASSTSFRQLVAVMKIDHPDAEALIKQYLEAVDKRFDDYKELEQYFREKDEQGNTLWEDQNLQSGKYNSRRKKLHKALFGELRNVLKRGNLEYKLV